MDLQLRGKAALVTGSSSGLGAAIAKTLAAEGVRVVVTGRDAKRAAQTAAEIAANGGEAFVAVGNLTSDDEVERIVKAAEEQVGSVDILVNNAGGPLLADENPGWMQITPDDYIGSFQINVVAAIRLALRLVPSMCERGWGRVINISSVAARQALGSMHDYGVAKAGIENWSLNLSKNVAAQGVTVNTIEPGMFMTPGSVEFLETLRDQRGWPDDIDIMQRNYVREGFPQPVERLGRPEELGAVVAFLASPLSGYTTGAVWRVDGGTSMCM